MDELATFLAVFGAVKEIVGGIASIYYGEQGGEESKESANEESKESSNQLTKLQSRIDQSEREQKQQREKHEQEMKNIQKGHNQRQSEVDRKMKELELKHDQKMKSLITNRESDRRAFNAEIEKIAAQSKRYMQTMKCSEAKQRLQFLLQHFQSMAEALTDKNKHIQKLFPKYKQINDQVIHEQKHLQKFENELDDKMLLRVVLLGVTGHGKSTFGNRLCGDESEECINALFKVSAKINSETKHINKSLVKLKNKGRTLRLTVVDTPGFDDSDDEDSININNLIEWLRGCGGVNAFVIVNQYGRYNMTYQLMLKRLQRLLGVAFWKHVIFVITNVEGNTKINGFPEYKQDLMEKLQTDPKFHLQVLQQHQHQHQQQSNENYYTRNGRRGSSSNEYTTIMDEGKMDEPPYSDHSQSNSSRSRPRPRFQPQSRPLSLPIIGISNITRANYRVKIPTFLSVIPRVRFECKSLVSPLNALKLQCNIKLDELLCLLRVKTQKEYQLIITYEQITALEQKLQKSGGGGSSTTAVLLDQILQQGSNDAMGIPREMYDVKESLQRKRNPSFIGKEPGGGGGRITRTPPKNMGGFPSMAPSKKKSPMSSSSSSSTPYNFYLLSTMMDARELAKLESLGYSSQRISQALNIFLSSNLSTSQEMSAKNVMPFLDMTSDEDGSAFHGSKKVKPPQIQTQQQANSYFSHGYGAVSHETVVNTLTRSQYNNNNNNNGNSAGQQAKNNSTCPYIQMLSDVDYEQLFGLGMEESQMSELIQLALIRNEENCTDLNANTIVLQLISKSDFERLQSIGYDCNRMASSVCRMLRKNEKQFDISSILQNM